MTSIIAWMIARGISPRIAAAVVRIAGILLALAVAVGLWNLWIIRHDRATIDKHESGVQIEIERAGRAADRSLVERQTAGERSVSFERRGFDNATRDIPHEGLTRRQRIDLCLELRDGGADTTVIPQCADIRARAAPRRND